MFDQKLAFLELKKIKDQKSQDFLIKNLDPLGLDGEIDKLPLLNKAGDVNGLTNFLYSIIPFPEQIQKFNYNESIAAMRDIGMFLGSIKKHGVEPLIAVPELDYILDELSYKTDLPPRDTLLHYTIWNPDDERMRTYTSFSDERELINSVKIATYPLLNAIEYLVELHRTDFEDNKFEEICLKAADEFKFVVDGIVHSKRNVSPEIFAKELRFYFEPIRIYKEDVIGPGAVEMPMFIFDHLLWSSDCFNVSYKSFKTGFLPFILPYLREVYYNFDAKPSLISKACDHIHKTKNLTAMMKSLKALSKLCNLQKSFRMPHKKIADEAYEHEDKNLKEKGSGGYSTSVLSEIIDLNLKQISKLSDSIYVLGNLNYL